MLLDVRLVVTFYELGRWVEFGKGMGMGVSRVFIMFYFLTWWVFQECDPFVICH